MVSALSVPILNAAKAAVDESTRAATTVANKMMMVRLAAMNR